MQALALIEKVGALSMKEILLPKTSKSWKVISTCAVEAGSIRMSRSVKLNLPSFATVSLPMMTELVSRFESVKSMAAIALFSLL